MKTSHLIAFVSGVMASLLATYMWERHLKERV